MGVCVKVLCFLAALCCLFFFATGHMCIRKEHPWSRPQHIHCPTPWDYPNAIYCCGTLSHRRCCNSPGTRPNTSGNIGLIMGIGISFVVVCIIVIFCFFCGSQRREGRLLYQNIGYGSQGSQGFAPAWQPAARRPIPTPYPKQKPFPPYQELPGPPPGAPLLPQNNDYPPPYIACVNSTPHSTAQKLTDR